MLFGPRNDANLNGTCPAFMSGLPGLGCNTDVQLPYRMVITPETHSTECKAGCEDKVKVWDVIVATQAAQNAQAGYAADYQNKNGVRGFAEINEFIKGHRTLGHTLEETTHTRTDAETNAYAFHRHSTRMLSDFYGKGVVRSNQESVNLRVNARRNDVTAAESIKTSLTAMMPGLDLLTVLQRRQSTTAQYEETRAACRLQRNYRLSHEKVHVSKNDAFIYCHRPGSKSTKTEFDLLSAYDFFSLWSIELADWPKTVDEVCDFEKDDDNCHARVTLTGMQKLTTCKDEKSQVRWKPGVDFIIKEKCSQHWEPLPDIPELQKLRHTWILQRNRRPRCPKFMYCPMPKHHDGQQERNAQILFAYFHPFTLRSDIACEGNPLPENLRQNNETWCEKLEIWLQGNVQTQESARYIRNYMNVTQMRPGNVQEDETGSFADCSDEELQRDTQNIENMLRTRGGASKEAKEDAEEDWETEELTRAHMVRIDETWPAPQQCERKRTNETKSCTQEEFKSIKKAQSFSRSRAMDDIWSTEERDGRCKEQQPIRAQFLKYLLQKKKMK